jgi:hypothetical protein
MNVRLNMAENVVLYALCVHLLCRLIYSVCTIQLDVVYYFVNSFRVPTKEKRKKENNEGPAVRTNDLKGVSF